MNSEFPTIIKDFILSLPQLIPVIQQYLSEKENDIVFINKSPKLIDPLILNEHCKTESCISVGDFMKHVIERWREEIEYSEEVISLKTQICTQFDEYIKKNNMHEDKNYTKLVMDQRNRIIDELYNLIEFDQKQKAGNFCVGLLNGFHTDLPKSIIEISNYIFFTYFIKQLPLKLIDSIRSSLNKIAAKNSIDLLLNEIPLIILDLKKDLQFSLIQSNEILEIIDLMKMLCENRKYCTMELNLNNNKLLQIMPLIDEYSKKCVKTIEVISPCDIYIKTHLPFIYQGLQLKSLIDAKNFDDFVEKIPKFLTKLVISVKNDVSSKNIETLLKLFKHLSFLKYLHIEFYQNPIGDKELSLLSDSLSSTTKMIYFHLTISQENAVLTEKGFDCLSNILLLMPELNYLHLDIMTSATNFTEIVLEKLFLSIKNMKQLIELSLKLKLNPITDNSICLLADAIKHLCHLTKFDLNIVGEDHDVTDHGIHSLSLAIQNSLFLQSLKLNLSYGSVHITDVGLQSLADLCKQLQYLEEINLNFSGDDKQISDVSVKYLAESLKELKALKIVHLVLCGNKVTHEGRSYIFDLQKLNKDLRARCINEWLTQYCQRLKYLNSCIQETIIWIL